MENTVNSRVLMLKKHLKLTDVNFCHKAGFSTGTLFRIRKDEAVSSKVIDQIVENFGVDREWLLHGKGELKIDQSVRVSEDGSKQSWSARAYEAMKSKNDHLEQEVKYLREMLKQTISQMGAANFPNDIDPAGLFIKEKSVDIVRAAA